LIRGGPWAGAIQEQSMADDLLAIGEIVETGNESWRFKSRA
jgi:hypothetical protein